MKVIRPIYLAYTTAISTQTAIVSVPFDVKFINVKAIGYTTAVAGNYVTVVSDLSDNQPLGMVTRNNTFDSAQQNILIEFPVPKKIQGSYKFWLVDTTNTVVTGTGATDHCAIILEFYDDNAYPPRVELKQRQFLDLPTAEVV